MWTYTHPLGPWSTAIAAITALLCGGCASMLPNSHTDSSSFQSFEEARSVIEGLVPMATTAQMVEKSGMGMDAQPNSKLLTHSDVVRLLVPASVLRAEDLDPGVLACVRAREACHGIEIIASRISKKRTGNFFADFTSFKQRTETTGWRFNALILFVDDLVVYRSWGGQPRVNDVDVAVKPMGPFQDMGPALVSTGR